MRETEAQLKRLAALARQDPAEPAAFMPPGFDTTVVACAARIPQDSEWLAWERLAPRSLGLAAAICIIALLAATRSRTAVDVNEMQMATAIIERAIHP
jgi:hypothetical protein